MPYIDKKKFNIYYDVQDMRISAPLFEVDEFIAPIISLLNKKGYKTMYCCSGHITDCKYGGNSSPNSICYIMFSDKRLFEDLKIPPDFKCENSSYYENSITIRKNYQNKGIDRWYEIMDTMKELYKWAENLTSINEI